MKATPSGGLQGRLGILSGRDLAGRDVEGDDHRRSAGPPQQRLLSVQVTAMMNTSTEPNFLTLQMSFHCLPCWIIPYFVI